MEKRFIVLDTETTGLEVEKGHRIIEIGGVVMNGRKKTSETFHAYINPQREIDKEAQAVHGISNEDLEDKPFFSDIAEDFLEFIDGSTLVIHNADFDIGFLDAELKIASSTYPAISDICEIKDTLAIARNKFQDKEIRLMHYQNALKLVDMIEVIMVHYLMPTYWQMFIQT